MGGKQKHWLEVGRDIKWPCHEMGENKLDFLLNKGRRCNDFTCKSLYSLKNTEFRRELFVISSNVNILCTYRTVWHSARYNCNIFAFLDSCQYADSGSRTLRQVH